jgi:hypothetical protein
MRAHLRVRITPDDVGSRVSVRTRDEASGYTDVVGELEAWSEGRLAIRRRVGQTVTLAEQSLVAGKVVPPPPPKRG